MCRLLVCIKKVASDDACLLILCQIIKENCHGIVAENGVWIQEKEYVSRRLGDSKVVCFAETEVGICNDELYVLAGGKSLCTVVFRCVVHNNHLVRAAMNPLGNALQALFHKVRSVIVDYDYRDLHDDSDLVGISQRRIILFWQTNAVKNTNWMNGTMPRKMYSW